MRSDILRIQRDNNFPLIDGSKRVLKFEINPINRQEHPLRFAERLRITNAVVVPTARKPELRCVIFPITESDGKTFAVIGNLVDMEFVGVTDHNNNFRYLVFCCLDLPATTSLLGHQGDERIARFSELSIRN